MLVLLSTTAYADQQKADAEDREACASWAETSTIIANDRYLGIPIAKTIKLRVVLKPHQKEVNEQLQKIIYAAYKLTDWASEKNQRAEAIKFGNRIYLECMGE